jgi:hypothetical protein
MDHVSFTLLFEIVSYSENKMIPVLRCVSKKTCAKIQDHPDFLRTYLNSVYNLALEPKLDDCLDAIKMLNTDHLFKFCKNPQGSRMLMAIDVTQ